MRSLGLLLLLCTSHFCVSGSSERPLPEEAWEDPFESGSKAWKAVSFEGAAGGSHAIAEGILSIENEGGGLYGVYHSQPVSGHFYVIAEHVSDDNVALVLFQNKGGQADLENYTLLRVETLEGTVQVAVNDRQDGTQNVLDRTQSKIPFTEGHPEDGYVHVLTGNQISLPYRKTDKRLKIFRHHGSDYFQFYYGVKETIHGSQGADWMELRPTPNWSKGDSFFVGLVSTGGVAEFTNIRIYPVPMSDRDDRETGFALTQRDYNWSGYSGPAHVLTFAKENPYLNKDLKFVFWSEFNWVPHWHLTDQLAYSYEFVETWTGPDADWDQSGCYEPMSDRLKVHSKVKVLEDNPVRKVLRWEYSLLNPKYEIPYNRGTQMPLVQETYTMYPDGVGVRHIRYYPKLDIDELDWNEVSEPMLISGNQSNCRDFADDPPLSLFNLSGKSQELYKRNKFGYGSEVDDYLQVIAQVHFKSHLQLPDIMEVFSTDPEYPDTYPGLPLRFEHTWHSPEGILTHWPVNKRPYHGMAHSGPRSVDPHVEVSHASLVSVGCRELGVYPANSHYERFGRTDTLNGREYLEWSFLIGPVAHGELEEARRLTRSWLIREEAIYMPDTSCTFLGVSEAEKALVFRQISGGAHCRIHTDQRILVNPVFRIENWSGKQALKMSIDGTQLPNYLYRSHLKPNGDLLVFLRATLSGSTEISLTELPAGQEFSMAK